jgi:hypothetical protein
MTLSNDIGHNVTEPDDIGHNVTEPNDTEHNETKHNVTEQNDTQHKKHLGQKMRHSLLMLSVTVKSIMLGALCWVSFRWMLLRTVSLCCMSWRHVVR